MFSQSALQEPPRRSWDLWKVRSVGGGKQPTTIAPVVGSHSCDGTPDWKNQHLIQHLAASLLSHWHSPSLSQNGSPHIFGSYRRECDPHEKVKINFFGAGWLVCNGSTTKSGPSPAPKQHIGTVKQEEASVVQMRTQIKEKKYTLDKKRHQNEKWKKSQRLGNWIFSPLRTAAYVNVPFQSPNFTQHNQIKQLVSPLDPVPFELQIRITILLNCEIRASGPRTVLTTKKLPIYESVRQPKRHCEFRWKDEKNQNQTQQ